MAKQDSIEVDGTVVEALSYTSSPSYKSIKNILVTGSVKPESETTESTTTHKAHGITRGADYYRR